MQMTILAVSGKQPAWLRDAVEDYARRLRARVRLELVDLKAESRSRGLSVAALRKAEAERVRAKLPPAARCIALDERGVTQTTQELGSAIDSWRRRGDQHIAFVVGGPDGLDSALLKDAQSVWSLSKLTLPHGLAKLVLVEQLYRAWTLLEGHPYHRD